jgi:hypothetical protein
VGNLPIQLPLAQGFVMINMLVLFGQFFAKAYGSKSKDSKGTKNIKLHLFIFLKIRLYFVMVYIF